MIKHGLKIEDNYLQNLKNGIKTCAIRYNDKDYQRDDILEFWDSKESEFVWFEITHIHSGLGLKEGYVVLSLRRIAKLKRIAKGSK